MMFVWASLLHILHGNRPYALSRNSHPITPFNPTGPHEYKPLVEKLQARIELALKVPLPSCFKTGKTILGDFRTYMATTQDSFDAIITSPPFPGLRFDRPNWLRLWFCGWGERNFHEDSLTFLEREQMKSMDCYCDFFSSAHRVLKRHGLLIVHAGNSDNMPRELIARSRDSFTLLGEVSEGVSDIEKHGLSDKRRTTAHHFLFFRPQ